MLTKTFIALSALALAAPALARERWLERDNRFVALYPRRFGQENPAVLSQLSAACPGGVCATLAGQAISTLLAGAGECTQQDQADAIIDAAAQFDATTAANMIALAVEFRQAEKNTPPDFTTNPETFRNSVFCQTAPKNAQLVGLNQAQDPANNPNIFFDPATKTSVLKGSQANTIPLGSGAATSAVPPAAAAVAAPAAAAAAPAADDAAAAPAAAAAAPASNVALVSNAAAGGNLQTFAGSLGATPPPVTAIGNGSFQVTGNAAFNNLQNALVRSCDVQHNKCANAANASGNQGALSVNACQTQQDACNAQAKSTAAA